MSLIWEGASGEGVSHCGHQPHTNSSFTTCWGGLIASSYQQESASVSQQDFAVCQLSRGHTGGEAPLPFSLWGSCLLLPSFAGSVNSLCLYVCIDPIPLLCEGHSSDFYPNPVKIQARADFSPLPIPSSPLLCLLPQGFLI